MKANMNISVLCKGISLTIKFRKYSYAMYHEKRNQQYCSASASSNSCRSLTQPFCLLVYSTLIITSFPIPNYATPENRNLTDRPPLTPSPKRQNMLSIPHHSLETP
ncbi:hypothetical protein VTL71DRAFT_16276 [Oculimacula yallundae]|uniref:Uncharacterized protein n=1 Tax=Oculimacula yallundae TaxID=86028 RepID=A0ABR4CE12_9HELO